MSTFYTDTVRGGSSDLLRRPLLDSSAYGYDGNAATYEVSGYRSVAARWVQTVLFAAGFLRRDEIDGIGGPVTLAALREFVEFSGRAPALSPTTSVRGLHPGMPRRIVISNALDQILAGTPRAWLSTPQELPPLSSPSPGLDPIQVDQPAPLAPSDPSKPPPGAPAPMVARASAVPPVAVFLGVGLVALLAVAWAKSSR
jgi:hypothetical protein